MTADLTAPSHFPGTVAPVAHFPSRASLFESPDLFVVVVSHRTAPLAVRENLALDAGAEAALAGELSRIPELREFVILSTCNRLEICGAAARPLAAARAQAALCANRGIAAEVFEKFHFTFEGAEVARHLMEVAVGLDSQMLGETEIFGQMKRAYEAAQARGSTGPVLNRLFQKVFQGAKQARTETSIAVGQVSVANIAVDLASGIFGDLASVRILLLGTGEMGGKTARAFHSRGARSLTLASRSLDRAISLAAEFGADGLPFDRREESLADFDVVVSCTSAPGTILSAPAVRAAMRRRPDRPMLLVDLALPRDIEAAAGGVGGVFLSNLDDLARIAENNKAARAAEVAKCRALIGARASAIWTNLMRQASAGPRALAS